MQPVEVRAPVDPVPDTVHTAIYYMAAQGVPPPDMELFHRALREWPDAFQALARADPINRELKWTRRKGLLVPMAMWHPLRDRRGGDSVLKVLATHEAVWPCVLQFI
jgi:hypothetical protein